MNEYVEISITGNIAGAKKLDILEIETPIPIKDTPANHGVNLNGGSFYSIGVGKKVWKFIAGIYYGDARSGYATMTDVKAIFEAETSTAILLKFRDWFDATVYDAYLLNKGAGDAFEMVSATIDSASSYYKVTFELRQA
jgi:hypothetical protein